MKETRRQFLFKSGCALSMTAMATQIEHFGLVSAFAQKSRKSTRLGDVPSDYRALVCIFLSGGNDGNNMVVPHHSDANVSGYAAYSAARASQNLALAQNSLLPIAVPRIGNLTYGLHPALGTVAGGLNGGLHPLWEQGKMAVVANVGTLTQPLTRAQYQQGAARPSQLFSHTDQVLQHQRGRSDIVTLTGWGGLLSDKITFAANPNRLVPTLSSLAGTQLFTIGATTQPLSLAPAPTPLSNVLALTGYNNTPADNARFGALNEALVIGNDHELVAASNNLHRQAIEISRSLNDSPDTTVNFPNTEIGNQLKQVARMIKSRTALGVNRQIFFCTIGGFDTHASQLTLQNALLFQLSQAMRALYDEMTAQGLADKVTQFTMSDFNRTFDPGGSGALVGSDHGWGNHSFVVGGSVHGGDFYGVDTSNGTPFPTLVNNGPDDADFGNNARGRWIPTTSVEQFAATLAAWFGLEAADLQYVFPNIVSFPTKNLGFMAA